MSLAFALMAAINGSAGSSAILTYGLKGTKPHRRQPDGDKILTAPGRRRKPSETLTWKQIRRKYWGRHWTGPDGARLAWPGEVPVTRYQYRGHRIPSPWATTGTGQATARPEAAVA